MPISDSPNHEMQALLRRLANRDRVRSEATVQADIRTLLLSGGLGLADHDLEVDLETQVGDRRRIDIEVGFTVIEVKKDLRAAGVVEAAVEQLAGYVATRHQQTGQRYVGILSDGAEWRAYNLRDGELVEVKGFVLKKSRPDLTALLFWLEGVLATRQAVPPTPHEIASSLGASSSSYALDQASLKALYEDHRTDPTVQLKRELWAKLLRSALGTQFEDDDDLFLEHTLLVNSADIIAHLVVGLDVTDLQPATLLSGQRFEQAQVYGVVEQDFFDWVLEVPGGPSFISTLARRLARFNWEHVEHDVLKVLYESVIGTETRKQLGEYYTPDWLAEHVVETAVADPLHQRVLDPACGSGTFLFHAARRYIDAAIKAGIPLSETLSTLTNHVLGIDLHPVAVALARVTYLLAIGHERLIDEQRGPITVPVYLGDSIQWQQRLDLLSDGHLVVPTGSGSQLFEDELRFPDSLLKDAGRFDRLISTLTELANSPSRAAGRTPSLTAHFHRLAIAEEDQPTIKESFEMLCRLHDDGRDHIWSYYIRNLARPTWLSRPENRVDVLIGNPPWLSYRHMPEEMQAAFREMSQSRGLWHGREVATHQDLSGLFVARTIQQYLSQSGSFAFVLPNAVLDRRYFEGFRAGRYLDPEEPIAVAFGQSWDLRRLRPHFFPRGAAVVFGQRIPLEQSSPMPAQTIRWTGRLPRTNDTWEATNPHVTREIARLVFDDKDILESPYEPRFANGATIFPKIFFFVEKQSSGPLGWGAGRVAVKSQRSTTEKKPWKFLRSRDGVVESEFIRDVLLGESILPYRVLPPRLAVLPLEGATLLHGGHPHLDLYPGLAEWWRSAEQQWIEGRSSERLTLAENLNFRNKLTNQIPIPNLRLVYGASGMHVVAAIVEHQTAVCEHKLYWGTITSREEGLYLCAILNSPALTELVRPLMSYGKDERDIDKHIWKLPIPLYDAENPIHQRLVDLGRSEAQLVAALDVDETQNFVALRQQVRATLAAAPHGEEIEAIVTELLDS